MGVIYLFDTVTEQTHVISEENWYGTQLLISGEKHEFFVVHKAIYRLTLSEKQIGGGFNCKVQKVSNEDTWNHIQAGIYLGDGTLLLSSKYSGKMFLYSVNDKSYSQVLGNQSWKYTKSMVLHKGDIYAFDDYVWRITRSSSGMKAEQCSKDNGWYRMTSAVSKGDLIYTFSEYAKAVYEFDPVSTRSAAVYKDNPRVTPLISLKKELVLIPNYIIKLQLNEDPKQEPSVSNLSTESNWNYISHAASMDDRYLLCISSTKLTIYHPKTA